MERLDSPTPPLLLFASARDGRWGGGDDGLFAVLVCKLFRSDCSCVLVALVAAVVGVSMLLVR